MASSELGERKEEELLQQNSRICFPSFHPPTTFLVPSFTVQMIFFIAPAGNKLKSEREGARSCRCCHCLPGAARARAKPDAISKKLLNSIREMDRNGLGGIRSGGEGSGRSRFKGVEIGSLRHRPSGPFGDRGAALPESA